MSVASIINQVENRVIDLPPRVQSELSNLVSQAHFSIQRRHNFAFMEQLVTRTASFDDISIGDVVGGFKEYKDKPYWLDVSGVPQVMEVSRTEREALSGWVEDSNYGIGSPKLLEHLNVGNTMVWRVLPVPDGAGPDTDGAYTIRIPYWGYTGFPATDSWLTLNAEQYLVKQATAEAFFLAWDAVKGALWQQLADKEAAEVIKTDKKERLSHIGEIVHSRGVRAVKLRI